MEGSHSCSSGDDNCGIGDHSNSSNNHNNNNNKMHTHSAFNLRKAFELRQTRLQRTQREQPQSPLPQHQQPQFHTGNSNSSSSDKLHPPTPTQRAHHRRKRLQRQKSTELPDDVDFAYAADLEEEDEDYDDNDIDIDNDASPLHAYNLPTFASVKQLQLQQFAHALPFSGQPSSLPNCYSAPPAAYHCASSRTLHQLKHEESFDSTSTTRTTTTSNTRNSTDSTGNSAVSPTTRRHNFAMLKRDNSTQSESSSRYSSVDSLLEARKPDPEAILINLGFGPVGSEDILSRIPKRFLKPSQVRGIDTEAFIRRLQLADNLADHSVLGYRGLTGNPDVPPSRIVAKIMQRFEVNERKKSMGSLEHTI